MTKLFIKSSNELQTKEVFFMDFELLEIAFSLKLSNNFALMYYKQVQRILQYTN